MNNIFCINLRKESKGWNVSVNVTYMYQYM